MENHDKLFEQIKGAAHRAEEMEFPAMENVWSRVEDTLDKKLLKKQNRIWKKFAVAASFLLCASIAYQVFRTDEPQIRQQKNVVVTDSVDAQTNISPDNAVASDETATNKPKEGSLMRKDADIILKKHLDAKEEVAIQDNKKGNKEIESVAEDNLISSDSIYFARKNKNRPAIWNSGPVYSARSLKQDDKATFQAPEADTFDAILVTAKNPPLYVVDGKAASAEKAKQADLESIDSIYVLKEPLYIINGTEYSEAELFGPNPTSPYAPLTKQEIETITILKDDEAISNYGKKGKKGVVIISTKNGKPAKLAKQE